MTPTSPEHLASHDYFSQPPQISTLCGSDRCHLQYLESRIGATYAANEKLNIASIGAGGKAAGDIQASRIAEHRGLMRCGSGRAGECSISFRKPESSKTIA